MEPVTDRVWVHRNDSIDTIALQDLVARLAIPPLLARLLVCRGYTPEESEAFLGSRLSDLPDPFLLSDIKPAVIRLAEAIRAGEKISIHGDYDVDGISGTALLMSALRDLGADPEYHIPLRMRDGYGLSANAIENTARDGVRVIVSVDCGVSALEEALLARDLGMDLIITDHHQPSEELPEAFALINPQRSGTDFPDQDLAGVGVAFFLLVALRKQLREEGWFENRPEPDLRQYLDFVALGTIADLVPLTGVNRTLTRAGVALLESGSRVGVRALKQIAGVRKVNSGVVGFQLAPRLNAAGRMEDARMGVELLLEDDMVSALNTARHLDQCNRERREIEKRTLDEAIKAVDALPETFSHTIVLSRDGWHPGVVGIVASRIVERYHRPTVLIAVDGDHGKGSARSIRGYHLFRGMQSCADSLVSFGGHEMAAGLSVEKGNIVRFASQLEEHARSSLNEIDLVPKVLHDGLLLLEEIDPGVLEQMEAMAPFGIGNPEPVMVVEQVRAMQLKELNGGHVRFTACQGAYSHPAIAFGMADRLEEFKGEIDLLVSPQVNRYNGRETVQLRVRDVRGSVKSEK